MAAMKPHGLAALEPATRNVTIYEVRAVFKFDADNVVSYPLDQIPDAFTNRLPDFIGVYRSKTDGRQVSVADFYGVDAKALAVVFVNAVGHTHS